MRLTLGCKLWFGFGALILMLGARALFGKRGRRSTSAASGSPFRAMWTTGFLSFSRASKMTHRTVKRWQASMDRQYAHDGLDRLVERRTADLCAANRELEAFSYSIAHELKEPLFTIRTFSSLLRDDASLFDEAARRKIQHISQAGAEMGAMIDALLDLSRSARLPGTTARIDMNTLVAGVLQRMSATIDSRASIEVAADLPDVAADAVRVDRVLHNLISNALKFNRQAQPTVQIGVGRVAGRLAEFYIRDNGIGMAPEYHERVFGLFQRLNRREEYEGTGAGLAIVKRMVELSGGAVWVESDVSAGATMWFSLPVWSADAASAEAA